MLVLECNCPPSPTGLYSCGEIAPHLVPWLIAHEGFDRVAHIECRQNELTFEEQFFLWRRKDWQELETTRAKQQVESKQFTKEWWTKRFRMWRAVCYMYETMRRLGWKTAKETIMQWILLYENPQIPDRVKESVGSCLTLARWFEPVTQEDLDKFQQEWRSKRNHLYSNPYDITSEED